LIVAGEDDPGLDVQHIENYLRHFLERVDWNRDLHFQTQTTMDTLDYSGTAVNEGSKVVMAAAGKKCRQLAGQLPGGFQLPHGFADPRFVMPGILVVKAPAYQERSAAVEQMEGLATLLEHLPGLESIPLIVAVDDSEWTAREQNHFLWVTFTRSDPARDIYGAKSFVISKHWGCRGPLIIDARMKPHHAPPLIEDPQITKRVERLASPGRCLDGIL